MAQAPWDPQSPKGLQEPTRAPDTRLGSRILEPSTAYWVTVDQDEIHIIFSQNERD